MKQIAKSVLKGLFIVILFTGGSVALSTTGANTVSAANATVSANQVYQYLTEYGYTVMSCEPKPATKFDWTAHTIIGGRYFITTIHCNGQTIIGTDDSPL